MRGSDPAQERACSSVAEGQRSLRVGEFGARRDTRLLTACYREGVCMSLGTILIIILILLLVGALPAWPHSRGWGYFPVGGLGLLLIIILILVLMGRI